jgi:hypothetical protein
MLPHKAPDAGPGAVQGRKALVLFQRDDVPAPFYRFAPDPVFVALFIIMLVNDHLLRPHRILPSLNWVISDFAIMIFLPAAGALLAVYAKHLAGLVLGKITPGRVMMPYWLTMPIVLG